MESKETEHDGPNVHRAAESMMEDADFNLSPYICSSRFSLRLFNNLSQGAAPHSWIANILPSRTRKEELKQADK